MSELHRRGMLAASALAGLGLTAGAGVARAAPAAGLAGPTGQLLNALDFGATGDGKSDDAPALQRALDAVIGDTNGGVLMIPPGIYRVDRPLRIETRNGKHGNVTHACAIQAQGARLLSTIRSGEPVLEIVSHSVVRFLRIDGLEIQGNGHEGHGLALTCVERGRYLYNFSLRDLVVQGCGGDGCRLTGNVFEGQIFNSYFRDNGGNGARFAHGPEDTVLSAVHVFGCVFGGNARNGAVLADGAEDVGFYGCYFLLNGSFGLNVPHGVTLLSHCGFENNHRSAGSFAKGDAGIRLMVKGTLIGCTAYSIEYQTHLIRAYVTDELVMLGCKGSGGGHAKGAQLAKLKGNGDGRAFLVGMSGGIDRYHGIDIVNLGSSISGQFGQHWDDSDLLR
ncbi:MAG TPA: glycosyl hydrolase family 28-related protein, partial [Alphaproteobacteria bacterium]|nr:glycosyl hydrolase family 28-related protein [Alphaproteobacteria bacterium]